ncbi:MAG: phosphate transporter inner rane subunit PstA [Actinomycetia bacterium]|nr:phosphate transporter inner rane subunit PstA [Actinomycetes bacterium]
MTATMTPPNAPTPAEPPEWMLRRSVSAGRRVRNGLATMWMLLSVLAAMVPLVFVFGYVVQKGAHVISRAWFTKDLPIVDQFPGGGMKAAIIGTLVITLWATLMAVPLGVGAAIYLNEYGRHGRLARIIRFMADVMTGVPSIVMGLFVFAIFTLKYGLIGFGGSLALGALMLPIVIRSSEEMLRLVPDDLRHASDALGARRWHTVLRVILPAALPGIVSGSMLAVARAAGETAPLLFTIGAARNTNTNVFRGPNTALPLQIFNNATRPFDAAIARAWGSALTLVVIVFVFTVIARIVSARFSVRR